MTYFVLLYDVVDGFREKRTPYRPAHLALVREAHARGEILMAGALGDPPDGALLLFRAESAELVERFAEADPYVVNGLARWRVRPWSLAVGGDA